MRFLRLEYAPTIVLVLAVAQIASLADQDIFQLSYAVAGFFSFICLGSGVAVFLFLKDKDVSAARIAITTGVLFFIILFAFGEYLFATYFPG